MAAVAAAAAVGEGLVEAGPRELRLGLLDDGCEQAHRGEDVQVAPTLGIIVGHLLVLQQHLPQALQRHHPVRRHPSPVMMDQRHRMLLMLLLLLLCLTVVCGKHGLGRLDGLVGVVGVCCVEAAGGHGGGSGDGGEGAVELLPQRLGQRVDITEGQRAVVAETKNIINFLL